MTRVAGSSEARKAWIALRGPFLLSYILITVISLMIVPRVAEDVLIGMWAALIVVTGSALALGSFASFMVVARRQASRHWHCLELLEVSGLRALVAIQAIFAVTMAVNGASVTTILNNILLGTFALGILANLAWNRGRVSRGRQ